MRRTIAEKSEWTGYHSTDYSQQGFKYHFGCYSQATRGSNWKNDDPKDNEFSSRPVLCYHCFICVLVDNNKLAA